VFLRQLQQHLRSNCFLSFFFLYPSWTDKLLILRCTNAHNGAHGELGLLSQVGAVFKWAQAAHVSTAHAFVICYSDLFGTSGWQDAYSALCEAGGSTLNELKAFLADSSIQTLLKNALDPFPPTSAASKAQLETLTAAINITPAEDAPYNIKEIKEDALWLAGEAKLDEVAALRIVVLEWQKRPANRLLSGLYDTEAAAADHNIFAPTPPPQGQNDASAKESTQQRRTQLLKLYLSERLHLLKTSELVLRSFGMPQDSQQLANAAAQTIGDTLFQSFCPKYDFSNFLLQCATALQTRVDRMNSGPGWSAHEDGEIPAQESWLETQILETVIILLFIFDVAVLETEIPSAQSVTATFQFLRDVQFFASFTESVSLRDSLKHEILCANRLKQPTPRTLFIGTTLRTVTQIASLALLKLGKVKDQIDWLLYDDKAVKPTGSSLGYLSSATCIRDIHTLFIEMADNEAAPAASAMFAWSSIVVLLKEFSTTLTRRDSIDSSDSVNYPNLPQQQGPQEIVLGQAFDLVKAIPLSFEGPDPIAYLAFCAVNRLALFDQIIAMVSHLETKFGSIANESFETAARRQLLTLIVATAEKVRYGAENLGALLAVLGAEKPYRDFVDQSLSGSNAVTVADFFSEEQEAMIHEFLGEALARYPAEPIPYYRLMKTIICNGKMDSETMSQRLKQLQTAAQFTKRLPQGFRAYEEVIDNEMAQDMNVDSALPQRLIADLPFFLSGRSGRPILPKITSGRELALVNQIDLTATDCVPAGTVGTVADEESKPIVVSWEHEYSPLRYMIGCLYTVLAGNDWVDASTMAETPWDEVCDIISLLTGLVTGVQKSQKAKLDDDSQSIIRTVLESSFVDEDNKDVLNIVAEIFETHLQQQQEQPGHELSLQVLICCLHFFHAVATSLPSRVWPMLARSKLLDLDGNGGGLVAIVTSVEMVTGCYDFLMSSIRLFETLVDASLKPGSEGPKKPSRALTRFNSESTRQPGGEVLPHRIASAIMSGFTRTLISVFGNSRSWRYSSSMDQAEISTRLSAVFDKILHYSYGFDDEPDLQKKAITSILANSAAQLIDILLSDSPNLQLSDSLLDMLRSGLVAIAAQQSFDIERWRSLQVTSALALYETALRIGIFSDKPTSYLENQLFKDASVLGRLFVARETFKAPVAAVLEAMVISAARGQVEPPSLLGYMGPGPAKDFLDVLGNLSKPLCNPNVEVPIWRMLSAVVSCRQQWFAISLITGSAPRDRSKKAKDGENAKSQGKPLLTYALDQLSKIETVEPKLALAMLKFVTLCQNHWSWAVGELRQNEEFINGIAQYVKALKRDPSDSPERACTEASIAASVAEVLAMYLHSAFQVGDTKAIEQVEPNLQYFKKFGVAAPKYNSSLHANLKSHMEQNHGGLQPSQFKHTTAFPSEFGKNYFYDIPFASQVLNLRRSVRGKALAGTEENLDKANIDLSLVEAQVDLLQQWKILIIELSKGLRQYPKLVSLLIETVEKCLLENVGSSVPQAIFDQLRYKRLELALVLLQKLVALDIKDAEQQRNLRKLFPIAWDTVIKFQSDFDSAFQGPDVEYYRALLQILFLTLKPLTKPAPPQSDQQQRNGPKRPEQGQAPQDSQKLLEVLLHAVAKGFRSLASGLHEDTAGCQPNDFVLLTAILQTVLRIPGVDMLHAQIALQFSNNNLSGYATSLFSWADQLLINGDPVYGEYAVLFLLEMSSIPLVAESMAVDGVLSQLTSANIMLYYSRAKGMGPFDSPVRLHSIWTRGLLPLCLNLLDAVGAPIAAEIVSFLNHFPDQLKRLVTELANRNGPVGTRPTDSHITLNMASEVHSLSLIWLVLERYCAAGAATGTLMQDIPPLAWDKPSVKDDVEDWVQGRVTLGSMVVPANEREAELARLKPVRVGSGVGNRLEEKVLGELVAAGECLRADS
jgi:nuclear pore complex protein Nup188